MNGKQHLKIENGIYLPLTIELIGEGISTPFGEAKLYSFCHYYEQNGDLVQDPEMCFITVDNREDKSIDWEQVVIHPYMYQHGGLSRYEISIVIEGRKIVGFNKDLQRKHASFANQWFDQIRLLGFLKLC